MISRILAKKIINNITIKASCVTRITDPVILKLFLEGNREPLYVCYQYVITFGTRKRIIGLCNTAHVGSRYRYPRETINNKKKVMKYKLLLSNSMKHFPIHQYFFFF